jgi:alpha-methylacyl-CoA racemase
MQPLQGIKVLDFSTLLPGPLATLLLAEAGAEVTKIERPGSGDEARLFAPKLDGHSISFALLNRGKKSIALDLKAPDAKAKLTPLLESADVVVEQFRPGVMERLGLGYEQLKTIKPNIIYCAITGFGQSGPKAQLAAHDLNYIADTGMLALAAGADGAPVIPPALIADIAGGAYPAFMNIMLALYQRAQIGTGCKLDVSMSDNLFPLMYWGLGAGAALGRWPRSGGEMLTGGSPRYQIYRTQDDKFIAAAPLEDRFWRNFCDVIDLPAALRDDAIDAQATKRAVAEIIRRDSAAAWDERFAGHDACSVVVATLEEAARDPHFAARGLFDYRLKVGAREIAAMAVPIDGAFRGDKSEVRESPGLDS